MVTVRTFYWDPTARAGAGRAHRGRDWKVGNAGDLLNDVMVRALYGAEVLNTDDGQGRRLLLVGSVAHRIQAGDLVAGIGTKGAPIPGPTQQPCVVYATRGPITTDAFRVAGHDVNSLKFEFDPGLLIPRLMPSIPNPKKGRVIHIPHYRDATSKGFLPGRPRLVSVDVDPLTLAAQIAEAEFVFTSSLHGLIFAHALGRPCRLVAPASPEPLIKYQDYFASMGLPWRPLLSIDEARRERKRDSAVTLPDALRGVQLPSLGELSVRGIAA